MHTVRILCGRMFWIPKNWIWAADGGAWYVNRQLFFLAVPKVVWCFCSFSDSLPLWCFFLVDFSNNAGYLSHVHTVDGSVLSNFLCRNNFLPMACWSISVLSLLTMEIPMRVVCLLVLQSCYVHFHCRYLRHAGHTNLIMRASKMVKNPKHPLCRGRWALQTQSAPPKKWNGEAKRSGHKKTKHPKAKNNSSRR